MRRRPREGNKISVPFSFDNGPTCVVRTGLVLSGGGARAAYQVGALRALQPYLEPEQGIQPLSVIIGSSIGAINGLIIGSTIKNGLNYTLEELEEMWRKRNFRNTFSGTPSQAFFRAVKMAVLQYLAPGPNATSAAIFDPTPLMQEIDGVISKNGGLSPEARHPSLTAVAVMTTVEGKERKPLVFLSSATQPDPDVMTGASFDFVNVKELAAKHGFASAALPSVLPPVELDVEGGKIRLVDGGISQNIPVDPAVRLGADRVLVLDVSGRDWWLDRYNESHDTRPTWEVPAGMKTFCLRPPETFVSRVQKGLGQLLKETVGSSRGRFMTALGPVWPVFSLLKNKLGEEIAYEAMTYVALDPEYIQALIERGYNETLFLLRKKGALLYERSESYERWMEEL